MRRLASRPAALVALLACGGLVAAGCGAAATRYAPRVTARGELTLRYAQGFEVWGGGRRVARSLRWQGLSTHVRCVPAAKASADRAARAGGAAIALSTLGGLLGAASVGGLLGAAIDRPGVASPGMPRGSADPDGGGISARTGAWLGGGVATATVGAILAGVGRMMKNAANGQAVDAMNLYNDDVGSLGASCDELTYPPPFAAEPPPPSPPSEEAAPPG